MHAQTWLCTAQHNLDSAGIGTARLDALILLEDATSKDRAWLLAHPEFALTQVQVKKLKNLLNQRAKHVPLAYLRGKTEFYGREFLLTHEVLEPRPESESMIDALKAVVASDSQLSSTPYIADVGTGSGALGITARLEVPKCRVDLLDIDEQALKVANMNVDKFTLTISVLRSDLLTDTRAHYDILLCNLPYVPDDFHINPAAMHEPKIAIFGGPDGLDVYRKLFAQVQKRTNTPLYILSEALPPQHTVLQRIAKAAGYSMVGMDDFIQTYKLA